jgi:DNA modification methylase
LSPFGGVGSEGYCALKMKRKAILIELKETYYSQLCKNLTNVEKINTFDF